MPHCHHAELDHSGKFSDVTRKQDFEYIVTAQLGKIPFSSTRK